MRSRAGGAVLIVLLLIIYHFLPTGLPLAKGKVHARRVIAGYVNPVGKGLTPYRIDMGVDYEGNGSLYAIGSGTITNIYNSGWPGGAFIGLHLDSGKYAGRYVYYAEDVHPSVSTGQHVSAGQVVGSTQSCAAGWPQCGVELGWAAPPGHGQTMADAAGQDQAGNSHGDPGYYPTGYGVNYSQLIISLGGPGGYTHGFDTHSPVQG